MVCRISSRIYSIASRIPPGLLDSCLVVRCLVVWLVPSWKGRGVQFGSNSLIEPKGLFVWVLGRSIVSRIPPGLFLWLFARLVVWSLDFVVLEGTWTLRIRS